MIVLTEQQRNEKRYSRLPNEKKAVVNEIALNEFLKPVKERIRPVDALDQIEFSKKTLVS